MKFYQKKNNWYKIRYLEKTGYAYSKYLKYSRTVSNPKVHTFQQTLSYIIIGVFGGIILFVSFIPNGTFLVKSNSVLEVMRVIKKNNEPVQYSNENELVKILKEGVKNGENKEIQIQHIKNVNDMLGKDSIFD